jgi:hypothetical protein
MRRLILWAMPLLMLAPGGLRAQDEKEKPKTEQLGSPAEQVKALDTEFQKALKALGEAVGEAKTVEQRQKLVGDFKKDTVASYAKRFLEIAEKNPKDPASFDALKWIVEIMAQGIAPAKPQVDKTVELLKGHLDHEEIGGVLEALVGADSSAGEKLLRAVVEKSPKRKIKAEATMKLAQLLKDRAESMPAQSVPLYKEATALFDKVINSYGDVEGLAEAAKSSRFEILHLAIGKVAPEIEGEDADGKKFKLSDYRGKVVVLDFWAEW